MEEHQRVYGLEPVFDERSKALVLGSFPSVKSRQTEFYYGNPQNRFWGMLCEYFGEPPLQTVEDKRAFALKKGIALWDTVISCEIVGSADSQIRRYERANLEIILEKASVQKILLNGKKALAVFEEGYKDCGIDYVCLPSTSPANPRYKKEEWRKALDDVFAVTR